MSEDLTVEALAAMDYEPWDLAKCDLPTTREYIEDAYGNLEILRIGYALCSRSKQENAKVAQDLGGDAVSGLLAELLRVENYYKALSAVASSATARMMCGMAVLAEREERGA